MFWTILPAGAGLSENRHLASAGWQKCDRPRPKIDSNWHFCSPSAVPVARLRGIARTGRTTEGVPRRVRGPPPSRAGPFPPDEHASLQRHSTGVADEWLTGASEDANRWCRLATDARPPWREARLSRPVRHDCEVRHRLPSTRSIRRGQEWHPADCWGDGATPEGSRLREGILRRESRTRSLALAARMTWRGQIFQVVTQRRSGSTDASTHLVLATTNPRRYECCRRQFADTRPCLQRSSCKSCAGWLPPSRTLS